MEQKPLVSVVIPVYNMEAYLEETVRSVQASTYPSLEIILMDDGSKDQSLAVARRLAEEDPRIHVYTQPNGGVSEARNQAIARAKGSLILPVDADNTIHPAFIAEAVRELLRSDEVKVVCPRSDFFGDRSGEWILPPFSLHLLARKNIMDTCAMYRKADWERVHGYCREIIAREDWEFWIAVLKNGGKVVRLPEIRLHYRVRNQSKRVGDRQLKRHVVDTLNKRHADFFFRELGGPLRYQRSWSRVINFFSRLIHPMKAFIYSRYAEMGNWLFQLPAHFEEEGVCIYKGRNELREVSIGDKTFVVKSYKRPHLLNRFAYAYIRSSKAERACRYAHMFREKGIGSPEPVGYLTRGGAGLFDKSYFVCLKSECPYTYRDFATHTFSRQTEILRAIGRVTARMHDAGFYHEDYSAGNILFRDDLPEIQIEIIDLNRLSFGKIGLEKGCKNFERLPGSDEMLSVMAEAYAEVRGFDAQECLTLIRKYVDEELDYRKKKAQSV